MKDYDKILPKEREQTVLINFKIEQSTHDQLKKKLVKRGIRQSDFFRAVVQDYLREK
jgi:hypothetical protein